MERWLPVVGYEGLYEASNEGRVRSVERIVSRRGKGGVASWKPVAARILKPSPSHDYPAVNLSKEGRFRTVRVHVLVARAFIGPAPIDQEVRHKSGDRANPGLTNLEYGTRKQNCEDAIKHGQMIGPNNGRAKLSADDVRAIRKLSNVCADHLGLRFGVSAGTVRNIWAGRTYRSVV